MADAQEGMINNSATAEEILSPGTNFEGRLEIHELLGQGATASVYRARHLQLDKIVALKLLHQTGRDELSGRRFAREARALCQLDHQNIVRLHAYGKSCDDRYYMIMEFVAGVTLSRLLQDGPFGAQRAILIAKQLSAGLHQAHCVGLVHRDLKPGNIMLIENDQTVAVVKILDFGLAWLRPKGDEQNLTSTGVLLGTPLYMSPEQCRGEEVDARSDIYSFGCLMYECVTGKPPFDEDSSFKLMSRHADEVVTRVPAAIPASLAAIILRMMAKAPADRYQSMIEISEDLERVSCASNQTDQSKTVMVNRTRLLIGSLCVVVIVLVVLYMVAVPAPVTLNKSTKMTNPPLALCDPDDLHIDDPRERAVYYRNWFAKHERQSDVSTLGFAHYYLGLVLGAVAAKEKDHFKQEQYQKETSQHSAVAIKYFLAALKGYREGKLKIDNDRLSRLLDAVTSLCESTGDYKTTEELLRYRVKLVTGWSPPGDVIWGMTRDNLAYHLSLHSREEEAAVLWSTISKFGGKFKPEWEFTVHKRYAQLLVKLKRPIEAGREIEAAARCARKCSPEEADEGTLFEQVAALWQSTGNFDLASKSFLESSEFKPVGSLDRFKNKLRAGVALSVGKHNVEAARLLDDAAAHYKGRFDEETISLMAACKDFNTTTVCARMLARKLPDSDCRGKLDVWAQILRLYHCNELKPPSEYVKEAAVMMQSPPSGSWSWVAYLDLSRALRDAGCPVMDLAQALEKTARLLKDHPLGTNEHENRLAAAELEMEAAGNLFISGSGNYQNAIRLAKESYPCFIQELPPPEAAQHLCQENCIATLCKDYDFAGSLAEILVERIMKQPAHALAVPVLMNVVVNDLRAFDIGGRKDRLDHADSVLIVSEKIIAEYGTAPDWIAEECRIRALVRLAQGRLKEADKCNQKALGLWSRLPDSQRQIGEMNEVSKRISKAMKERKPAGQ